MGPDKSIISKSELAAELHLSRGRVSQLLATGMPVRTDGRLDRAEALAWYKANIVRPVNGASRGQRPPAGAPINTASSKSEQRPAPDRSSYLAGYEIGLACAAYKICQGLPEAFAKLCFGETFSGLMDRDDLAYRVFPAAAALTSLTRLCQAELDFAVYRMEWAPIPEPRFEESFGEEAEHARMLFAECAKVCKKHLPSGPAERYAKGDLVVDCEIGRRTGAARAAYRVCDAIASLFSELVFREPSKDEEYRREIDLELAGDPEYLAEMRLFKCVFPVSLLRVLLLGWCEEPLAWARKIGLPEVAGMRFEDLCGPKTEVVRKMFDEATSYLLGVLGPEEGEMSRPA